MWVWVQFVCLYVIVRDLCVYVDVCVCVCICVRDLE